VNGPVREAKATFAGPSAYHQPRGEKMSMVIVETEPGTLMRVTKEEADSLGLKEYIKPVAPEKNKAIKPAKTKKVEPVVVVEAVEEELSELADE
jgi:hypothetical protein